MLPWKFWSFVVKNEPFSNEVQELNIFFLHGSMHRVAMPWRQQSRTVQARGARKTRRRAEDQQLYNSTSIYIYIYAWLPGLIVGPCPSEENLYFPACPTPPFFRHCLPRSLKLRVSFPCICSPPVCIIRSVTSLSLTTTIWTSEQPFFSTDCYPNTSSDNTCVLGGGSFPVTTDGFSSRGVAAVRARRLFPSTISGVRGSVPVLPLGRKLDWQPVSSRAPKDPHLAVLAAAHSPF